MNAAGNEGGLRWKDIGKILKKGGAWQIFQCQGEVPESPERGRGGYF